MKNAIKFTEGVDASGLRFGSLHYKAGSVKALAINVGTTPSVNDLDSSGASLILVTPSAANAVISGIKAPASEWTRKTIINTSAFHLTLTDSDAASVAANRFKLGVNCVIAAHRSVDIIYDQTNLCWRIVGSEPTFAS